jgi:hypothetical protein
MARRRPVTLDGRDDVSRGNSRWGAIPLAGWIAAAMLCATSAGAATIDSFTYTQQGWSSVFGQDETGLELTGAFTGVVGPGGYIELGDLTAFSATLGIPGGTPHPLLLGDLAFFSFGTTSGPTTLSFAAEFDGNWTCMGLASTYFPGCNPDGSNPAEILGVFNTQRIPVLISDEAPAVTLVSSVDTTPPTGPVDPAPIPEPAAWATMLLGLIAIGGAMRVSRRRRGLASAYDRISPLVAVGAK